MTKETPCGECGMMVKPTEYHPFEACLMFKSGLQADSVRLIIQRIGEHFLAKVEAVDWTLVQSEEDLPEEPGRYLFTVQNKDGSRRVSLTHTRTLWSGKNVVAYRPEPLPYRGRGK